MHYIRREQETTTPRQKFPSSFKLVILREAKNLSAVEHHKLQILRFPQNDKLVGYLCRAVLRPRSLRVKPHSARKEPEYVPHRVGIHFRLEIRD